MPNRKELFADWLQDAYVMEHQAAELFENLAGRAKDDPELQTGILRHVAETRNHAYRLEQCLKILGTHVSGKKDGRNVKISRPVQALSILFGSDDILRDTIASFVFKQFELANYRALIAAAENIGENRIAEICRETLREEEVMSRLIERRIPLAAKQQLAAPTAAENANRIYG